MSERHTDLRFCTEEPNASNRIRQLVQVVPAKEILIIVIVRCTAQPLKRNQKMTSIAAMKKDLQAKFGDTVTTGQLGQFNRDYLRRARAGELEQIARGVWAVDAVGVAADSELVETTESPVDADKIKKRFDMLEKLGEGVVAGNIRSLIVAGSAGVGKTYMLERQLERAEATKQIKSYDSTKGTISAIGLYETLYNNRKAGQVLLLDDVDKVFYDDEALNLLKAALDTSAVRTISWSKASRYLGDQDIPTRFQYEGQIVFITNLDLDRTVAKQGRLAPHIAALMSRSIFLDLCIHNPKAIMVRVEQVMKESTLAEDLGLSKEQAADVISWMTANLGRLRSVSIRTVNQIAGFMKTSPEWKDMADNTLLKGF